jgi:maltose alpha-D-glucosyltransferase/alpha-amylase
VPQAVELDLARFDERVPVELIGQEAFPPIGKLPYLLTLPGHGYFAFRLAKDAHPPAWHEERLTPRRLPVLVLAPGWESVLEGRAGSPNAGQFFINVSHDKVRDEVLRPYVATRRWYGAKGDKVDDLRMSHVAAWKSDTGTWYMAFLDVTLANGAEQRYFLPVALEWETRDYDPQERFGAASITKVRYRDRMGVFYGAYANPEFGRALAIAMGRNEEVALGAGKLRFTSTALYGEYRDAVKGEVKVPGLEQSNTGVFFENKLFLKGYRRMRVGVNPELELGRFLTEKSPFANIAPLVGYAEYFEDGGEPITIAVLQKFVENQGDLWTLTLEHLARTLQTPPVATQPGTESAPEAAAADFHLSRMATLGRRVGEMHRALAKVTGDPAFDPEPITPQDMEAWKKRVAEELDDTFALIERLQKGNDKLRETVAPLLAARADLHERIAHTLPELGQLAKTRYHGDLHMGQVLVAQDDFIIVDFEGEPGRSLEERRAKTCVMRDVAGMVRSFSYANAAATRRDTPAAEGRANLLAHWQEDAVRCFLEGYREATQGVVSVPGDEASFQALLELFVLEKALYELRYEVANRPGWVDIPLRGLLQLATR